MPRSERDLLIAEIRRTLQAAAGQTRFIPMFARLHVFRRNPALYGPDGEPLDTSRLEDPPPPAIGDYFEPRTFGGLWDNLHQAWVPGAQPEHADQVVVFPCTAKQVEFVTFDEPGVGRIMNLGGPGTGKTRALSLVSLFQGGGLVDLRSHLNWGMVGATHERTFSPMYTDLFGDPESGGDAAAEGGIVPASWIAEAQGSRRASSRPMFARLVNGCFFDFRTGQIGSALRGSKVQGQSWHGASIDETQNVHDKTQRDIDERGRRAGLAYRVFETATNLLKSGHFAMRLEKYKESPQTHRLLRVKTTDNVFIHPGYWQRLRGFMSESEARQRLDAEDIDDLERVYSEFAYAENIRRPWPELVDITTQLTYERFQVARPVIAATDFGAVSTVTLWLKAYMDKLTRERVWFCHGEVTSRSHTNATQHAKKLKAVMPASDFLAVADPAINTKDADKSDYEQFRREGIDVRPAHHQPIQVKARVNMLKVLLCDGDGRRRFFIDCDERRTPVARELVKSLLTQDKPDQEYRKDTGSTYNDPTHWPSSAAFGMWPWEQLRAATPSIHEIMGAPGASDPLVKRAQEIAARRAGRGGYPYGH